MRLQISARKRLICTIYRGLARGDRKFSSRFRRRVLRSTSIRNGLGKLIRGTTGWTELMLGRIGLATFGLETEHKIGLAAWALIGPLRDDRPALQTALVQFVSQRGHLDLRSAHEREPTELRRLDGRRPLDFADDAGPQVI